MNSRSTPAMGYQDYLLIAEIKIDKRLQRYRHQFEPDYADQERYIALDAFSNH